MRKLGLAVMILLVLAVLPAMADPAQLQIIPAFSSVGINDTFSVDLVVYGLGNGAPPSVSTFDLTLSFDPAVIHATGADFGLLLGDPAWYEAFTGVVLSPDSINLAEVSLLSPSDLDALQPASFTLATLWFQAVGLGTTPLHFVPGTVPGVSGLDVKDGLGVLMSPITSLDGTIEVTGITPVPEPSSLTLALLMGGIVFVRTAARRLGAGLRR
ncbi:MAG: cohesin domain-containing protein [Candidatus Solibacter sp.]|nr:cohesin domain-containing protein [Candidatus Solibacter sp.]